MALDRSKPRYCPDDGTKLVKKDFGINKTPGLLCKKCENAFTTEKDFKR